MTRKKTTPACRDPSPAPATAKPEEAKRRDPSPDQLESLKTLNHLLLKETVERRGQVTDLRGKIDELGAEHGIVSSVEREVSGIYLSYLLSDASKSLDSVAREKGLIKRVLDLKEVEIRELESKVGHLEGKMGEMMAEKGQMEMRFTGEMNRMMGIVSELGQQKEEIARRLAERGHYVEQLEGHRSALQKENRMLEMTMALEIDELKENIVGKGLYIDLLESKEREFDGRLKSEVGERELCIKQLQGQKDAVEKEKRLMKMSFELKIGEMLAEMDELKGRIAEIVKENELMERQMVEKEACMDRLMREKKEEAEKLKSQLEGELQCLEVKLDGVMADNVAKKQRIDSLTEEKNLLQREMKAAEFDHEIVMVTLKKNMEEMGEELQRLQVEFDGLIAETEEKKKSIDSLKAEKESVDKRLEAVAADCQQMQATLAELNSYIAAKTKDIDSLTAEKESIERKMDDAGVNYERLQSEFDSMMADNEAKKKHIASLIEDKNLAERRMKAAETNFERVLAMLKSAAESIQMSPEKRDNCVEEMDEEVLRFAGAVEAIKAASESRLAEERAKNKGGVLWTWVYPATSTVVAAVSLAIAARAR